jgi:hypothetical protein
VGGSDAGGEGGASGGVPSGEGGAVSGGVAGAEAGAGERAEPAEFVVSLPAASCSINPTPGAPASKGSAGVVALAVAAVLRSIAREPADEDPDASE